MYILLILDEGIEGSKVIQDDSSSEVQEGKLPLQLAIVGRPNVGKSTLLNSLLQEDRVLVGPEVGLTRDSIRAEFEFQGRTVYLVNNSFTLFLLLITPSYTIFTLLHELKTLDNSTKLGNYDSMPVSRRRKNGF